jgi:hypothetical protein
MENPFHSITIAEVIFPVNPEPHPKLNPIPWSTPSIPPIISKLKNELPQKFKGEEHTKLNLFFQQLVSKVIIYTLL